MTNPLLVTGPLTLELRESDGRTEIVRCEIAPEVMEQLPFEHGGFRICPMPEQSQRADLWPEYLYVNPRRTMCGARLVTNPAPCLSAVRALNEKILAGRETPFDNDHFTGPDAFVCAVEHESDLAFAHRILKTLVVSVVIRNDGKWLLTVNRNENPLSEEDTIRLARVIGGKP